MPLYMWRPTLSIEKRLYIFGNGVTVDTIQPGAWKAARSVPDGTRSTISARLLRPAGRPQQSDSKGSLQLSPAALRFEGLLGLSTAYLQARRLLDRRGRSSLSLGPVIRGVYFVVFDADQFIFAEVDFRTRFLGCFSPHEGNESS